MKKQRFFMLGIITVLVAVLSLTFVSSTFAKYTTSGTAEDTARVAKWGVTITASGDSTAVLDTKDDATEVEIISNTGELLAPGTKGQLGSIALSGDPEVAVKVSYVATVTLTGWDASGYYCPLVVKVNGTPVDTSSVTTADQYAAAIKAAIEACGNNYTANEDITAEACLITWEWAFEGENEKDTALGNLAVAPKIDVRVDVTVEQID